MQVNSDRDSGIPKSQKVQKVRTGPNISPMHPKAEADMIVSDEDVTALTRGAKWYMDSIHDILKHSDIISLK